VKGKKEGRKVCPPTSLDCDWWGKEGRKEGRKEGKEGMSGRKEGRKD
jgi:hypothetical protein